MATPTRLAVVRPRAPSPFQGEEKFIPTARRSPPTRTASAVLRRFDLPALGEVGLGVCPVRHCDISKDEADGAEGAELVRVDDDAALLDAELGALAA